MLALTRMLLPPIMSQIRMFCPPLWMRRQGLCATHCTAAGHQGAIEMFSGAIMSSVYLQSSSTRGKHRTTMNRWGPMVQRQSNSYLTWFILYTVYCILVFTPSHFLVLIDHKVKASVGVCVCVCVISIVMMRNSQQPVDSNQEADVLSGQPHCSEDQKHSHESSTGDTGCSNAGQGGCHTKTGGKCSNLQQEGKRLSTNFC